MEKAQAKTSQLDELTIKKHDSLRETVAETLNKYYLPLEPKMTIGVYNKVLAEVEKPLLKETMQLLNNNQSRAAIILGLSRGTLRKLLKQYGLDNTPKKAAATTDVETTSAAKQIALREIVFKTVKEYYEQAKDTAANVYEMVLAEVEAPLLRETMNFTRGNQSRAAIVLGLSRGTLRKMLKKYDLE